MQMLFYHCIKYHWTASAFKKYFRQTGNLFIFITRLKRKNVFSFSVTWQVIRNLKQPIKKTKQTMTLLWTLCGVRLGGMEDRHNKSEGFTLDVLFLLDVYTTYSRHHKTVGDIPLVCTLFCQLSQEFAIQTRVRSGPSTTSKSRIPEDDYIQNRMSLQR